jgi:hypothetical protein
MAYNVFAVTPATNSDDKKDATGAFLPGAQRFANAFGGSFRSFNNVGAQVKKTFLQTLEDGPGGLDIFAYFGHGYKTQLGSAKIYTDKDMDQLADVLKTKMNLGGIIVLYACWAGFPGGFSTKLQEKIGRSVWIYGHTTLGHSYANPNVSEVQQDRNPRFRLLFDGSPLTAAWAEALRYTDMWIRFPVMWDEYIERELNAIRLLGKWKVQGGKTYVFEWSKTNGKYIGLDSINANPSGAERDDASKEKGSWVIDRRLEIRWDGGAREEWAMPLDPLAQQVIGVSGFATRLTHTLPGKSQI